MVAHLGTLLEPASLPTSPYPPHPFPSFSLSSHFPPRDPWMGWVQSESLVVVDLTVQHALLRLAEFQTLTIFDHNFYFHCSTFYSNPKIVKIIKYALYIHNNVSMI